MRRQNRLTATIGLLLAAAIGGCAAGNNEEPEHHTPAHKPADYPAAVDRLQIVHQEVLTGPLVAREVHATHHGHVHHHDHGHSHSHDDHSHDDDHDHVELDALQEMEDLVRWLPDLAADSDLEEEPWNRVHDIANQVTAILTKASSQIGDERRKTYLQYRTEINEHLRQLTEIKQQFPQPDQLAAGQTD